MVSQESHQSLPTRQLHQCETSSLLSELYYNDDHAGEPHGFSLQNYIPRALDRNEMIPGSTTNDEQGEPPTAGVIFSGDAMVEKTQSRASTQHASVVAASEYKELDLEISSTKSSRDPIVFPEGGREGWRVLAGSFVGLTGALALVNCSAITEHYISTVILPDTPVSSIAWIYSCYNLMGFGMVIFSGPIFDRVGCKIPIGAGVLMLTGGLMATSVATELYQFVLAYGLLAGLGAAFTFGPFVACVGHYFERRRAMAIGSAYIGGALGGVAFPFMFDHLFPTLGFGWTIRIAAFIVFALTSTGYFLVTDRHVEFNAMESKETLEKSVLRRVFELIDPTIFKNKVYASLVLALLGNGIAFLLALTFLISYASTFGYADKDTYLLMTVFNSALIPGRVIPSLIADKYGRYNSMCLICSLSTIFILILWANPSVGHLLKGLYAFAGLFGFSSGSMLSLTPALIGQIFPVSKIGLAIGTAFFVLATGDFAAIPIAGAINGAKTRQAFDNMVYFVAVISVCGTAACYLSRWFYVGFKIVKV